MDINNISPAGASGGGAHRVRDRKSPILKNLGDLFQKGEPPEPSPLDRASQALLKNNSSGTDELEVAWRYNAGSAVSRRIAAGSDGVVYGISDKGRVFAIDAANGNELWVSDQREHFSNPVIGKDGILYAGTASKKVYAFDAQTGKVLWKHTNSICARGSESPEIPVVGRDGTVFVASDMDRIVALDGKTGNEKWCFEMGAGQEQFTSIALDGANNLFACGHYGKLYVLDAKSGREKWGFPTGFRLTFSQPTVDDQGHIYLINGLQRDQDANNYPKGITRLLALREIKRKNIIGRVKADGERVWELTFECPTKSAHALGKINDNTVLFLPTGDGRLRAIEASGGRELWSTAIEERGVRQVAKGSDRRTPVVDEHEGIVYISSSDGVLYGIDGLTGKKKAIFDFRKELVAGKKQDLPLSLPSCGTDGSIYVADSRGDVWAFKNPRKTRDDRELNGETPTILNEEEAVLIDGLKLEKHK